MMLTLGGFESTHSYRNFEDKIVKTEQISNNLVALGHILKEKGWQIFSEKDIDHGYQVIVSNGTMRLPVNFYKTGKIVVQGKPCAMRSELLEWANLVQAGMKSKSAKSTQPHKNRIAKYLVIPDNIENIRQIILNLPGEISPKNTGGPAEIYRVEVRNDGARVTITQYSSGMLMVQGLSSPHFDAVCDLLDEYLTQSFSERAARFIVGETERTVVATYLEEPESENEATRWLLKQIDSSVLKFLYENDQRTLLAAAGVRNAFQKADRNLPDYSVVVMPFAKPFEGFMMRLAVHLGLTTEETLKQKANEIEIKSWLDSIKSRLPDIKRYGEIHASLEAAWQCRNKAIHSDFAHPLTVLKTLSEAEHEVATILRAMARAYTVFVTEGIKLSPVPPSTKAKPNSVSKLEDKYEHVDREHLRKQLEVDGFSVSVQPEGRKNAWEIIETDSTAKSPHRQTTQGRHPTLAVEIGKFWDGAPKIRVFWDFSPTRTPCF